MVRGYFFTWWNDLGHCDSAERSARLYNPKCKKSLPRKAHSLGHGQNIAIYPSAESGPYKDRWKIVSTFCRNIANLLN